MTRHSNPSKRQPSSDEAEAFYRNLDDQLYTERLQAYEEAPPMDAGDLYYARNEPTDDETY